MKKQKLEYWSIDKLIPYARNPRKNDHAVDQIAAAIREFGFRVPLLAKSDGTLVDGHLRLKAAQKLELKEVPVLLADDMTDIQIKAFRLSVNRMAELAEWDNELLKLEFEEIKLEGFDLELAGFDSEFLNTKEPERDEIEPNLINEFLLIVELENENEQQTLFESLQQQGYKVKIP
jgi:ParB-like chromosome segregation protein Spo0J